MRKEHGRRRTCRGSTAAFTLLGLMFGGIGSSARPAFAVEDSHAWTECRVVDPATGEVTIHPECFYHSLLSRYQTLAEYGDRTTVTRVSVRDGETPQRTETAAEVTVSDGRLEVRTASRQVRRALGLGLELPVIPALERAGQAYKLWIAPHMTLKFGATDIDLGSSASPSTRHQPASAASHHDGAGHDGATHDRVAHVAPGRHPVLAPCDDESGEPRGPVSAHVSPKIRLQATGAERVTIEQREMVHLELRSGDSASADSAVTYDLYIDPDSMLVERINGEERLQDGSTMHTTVEITPLVADPPLEFNADEVQSHAPSACPAG